MTENAYDTANTQVDITTDGGATWTASHKIEPIVANTTSSGLINIVCPTDTECVAVGYDDYWINTVPIPVESGSAILATSTDGGMTWQQQALPSGSGGVACLSATHCVLGAYRAVESITTTNGGATWTVTDEQVPGPDTNFRAIACPSMSQCVAVNTQATSNGNEIYTSSDGGSTWDSQPVTTQSSGTLVMLESVSCPSPTSCWTVGSIPSPTLGASGGSIILHSVTGGVAWPSIGSIIPTQGPATGGTHVTITGAGFLLPPTVTFGTGPGAVTATTVTVVSTHELNVTVPSCDCVPVPGGAPVQVTVSEPVLGQSPVNLNYLFTYEGS